MRSFRVAITLLLMAAAAAGQNAWADRGHHFHNFHSRGRVGVFIGAPLFWPWYYPPTYYPEPTVIAVPTSPPVYIERSDEEAGTEASGYWYRCDRPRGYYPYVKECPNGWRKEVPHAPPQ
jgi:hypothetical protein